MVLPRITAIDPDPYRPGAVRLVVDGRPYCAIPASAVAGEGIAAGHPFTDSLRARVDRLADQEAAFRTLLRALERRAHAKADLARRMARKGHPPEAVETALQRAEGAGLLDDAAFALDYVQTRAKRGRGPARVIRDLLSMGVERPLIDRAIAAEWPEGRDPEEAAFALAVKRASQLGDLPRAIKRRRLLAYLGRRGFAGRAVGEMVKRVVSGERSLACQAGGQGSVS